MNSASAVTAHVPAIRVENVHHAFAGHRALDGVTFSVPQQSIHGFVGPNGAGKTTTLKVIATLLRPESGSVHVFGIDVLNNPTGVRRRIGFMPDHFSMYRQMTVFEYLDFFAAAYGQNSADRDTTIADVLTLTDMTVRKEDFIKGLSRGMQQRLCLARVLIHDPDLLLLDEPASGLDPRARIELMQILRELQRRGKTIFISSHILSDLSDLCDSVTVMDRGVVRYNGALQGLLHETGNRELQTWILTVTQSDASVHQALTRLPGVVSVINDSKNPFRLVMTIRHQEVDPGALLACALAAGAKIREFHEEQRHLNQAFMDLTQAGVRA